MMGYVCIAMAGLVIGKEVINFAYLVINIARKVYINEALGNYRWPPKSDVETALHTEDRPEELPSSLMTNGVFRAGRLTM